MVSSLGLLFVWFIGRKTSPQNSSTGSSLFTWIYVLANPVVGIVECPLFDYLVPNHWHRVEKRDRLGGTSGHLRFSGRCLLIIASGCWSKALLVPLNPVKLLLFPRRRSTVRRPPATPQPHQTWPHWEWGWGCLGADQRQRCWKVVSMVEQRGSEVGH